LHHKRNIGGCFLSWGGWDIGDINLYQLVLQGVWNIKQLEYWGCEDSCENWCEAVIDYHIIYLLG